MKGYSEHRGQISRLDFDPETKQFVAQPIEHTVKPAPVYALLLGQVIKWRKLNRQNVVHHETLQQLSKLTAEQRDDLGMTEVFTQQKR